MPELRRDPIIDRWVIIAPERSMRPYAYFQPQDIEIDDFCPLCPGREAVTPPEVLVFGRSPEDADTPGWSVRVVPNKFPALRIEGELNPRRSGVNYRMQGIGAHEVIIETPNHEEQLADMPINRTAEVLLAYRERIRDLKRDRRFAYIHIFKNHGRAAGASLIHSHSQLIALPIVPEIPAEEMAASLNYYREKHCCIFCDMIAQESAEGRRIVRENVIEGAEMQQGRKCRHVKGCAPLHSFHS